MGRSLSIGEKGRKEGREKVRNVGITHDQGRGPASLKGEGGEKERGPRLSVGTKKGKSDMIKRSRRGWSTL